MRSGTGRKLVTGAIVALVIAGAVGWFSLDRGTRGLLATLPTNRDAVKVQLEEQFASLDPVRLLRDIRAAQQTLRDIATRTPSDVVTTPETADIATFLES